MFRAFVTLSYFVREAAKKTSTKLEWVRALEAGSLKKSLFLRLFNEISF